MIGKEPDREAAMICSFPLQSGGALPPTMADVDFSS